jgi:hypothetical protein
LESKEPKIDRSVPLWPEIREDGITPAGFGYVTGNKPCFSTQFGYISVYLPFTMVQNLATARQLFEGLEPEVNKILRSYPHDRGATVIVKGKPRYFWLKFVFGCIIPQELKNRPLVTSLTRYAGQDQLPPP